MEATGNETSTHNDNTNPPKNISFKFSKWSSKTLNRSNFDEDIENPEKILSIDNNEIKSSIFKEKKKNLVIAPIHKNVWRKPILENLKNSNESESEKSIKEQAIKELLQESAARNSDFSENDTSHKIPIVIQNKLPEGFETDDKLDVTLRAEDSTLEDYDNVPIAEFGVAVLRGLGVNPGDPIGNKNKKLVVPIEAVQRSKGLGLGAERKMGKGAKINENSSEELKLVKNAYVCVVQGSHKGSYGTIEGLDESRVIVKLNHLEQNISIPALYVNVISKKEFQKESKVINKASYEKYKNDENGKNESRYEETRSEESHSHRREKDSNHHSSRHSHSSKHKRKHSKEVSSKHESSERSVSWVQPLLRVRFIDGTYKKGKYFNQKMIVEDVLSFDNYICRTEDGKYLEDLQSSMLETVIPRSEPSSVMIVKGKHKSQLGEILSRNKKECTATVQLLSDRSKVVVLDYDNICEYVGDTSMFD